MSMRPRTIRKKSIVDYELESEQKRMTGERRRGYFATERGPEASKGRLMGEFSHLLSGCKTDFGECHDAIGRILLECTSMGRQLSHIGEEDASPRLWGWRLRFPRTMTPAKEGERTLGTPCELASRTPRYILADIAERM